MRFRNAVTVAGKADINERTLWFISEMVPKQWTKASNTPVLESQKKVDHDSKDE
jgi:hypothetical protein